MLPNSFEKSKPHNYRNQTQFATGKKTTHKCYTKSAFRFTHLRHALPTVPDRYSYK